MTVPHPIDAWMEKLAASLAEGTFVRLALSRRAPASPDTTAAKVTGRCIELRGAAHLSITFAHATRDITRNLPLPEALDWVRQQLGGVYHAALLATTRRDWQWILSPRGKSRLVGHQPSTRQAPPRAHDQPRRDLLDAAARDWLTGLGVTDPHGKVCASMADKYRQIKHYLEILSHLAADCGWIGGPPPAAAEELTIADMGCGKGYLTFGLWHLFQRVWRRPVRVTGIELRPDLVAATNDLAGRIGAQALEFRAGAIAAASLPEKLDGLIALHACNTATDDAILRGIRGGAQLIMVAPCCHQELRHQLGHPEPLGPLLRHGLMEERLAEWLTDGLRALHLEWAGYRTRLIEFVASEHTPRNLMIAGVRRAPAFANPAMRERILKLKDHFGVRRQALDSLLG